MGTAPPPAKSEFTPELRVGDTLRCTVRTLWRHRWTVGFCWLGWTVLLAGYYVFLNPSVVAYFNGVVGADIFAALEFWFLAAVIARVPYSVLKAVFIVLLLLTFLTGSPARSDRSRVGFAKAVLVMFLFEIVMSAIVSAPIRLLDKVARSPDVGFWRHELYIAYLGAQVLQMWLIARLCLVYPNIALGHGWQLRESLRGTSGFGLRLAGMLIFVVIPMAFAGERFNEWVVSLDFMQTYAREARSAIASALLVLRLTIVAALGAVVFTRLTEFPSAGISGDERTKTRLAAIFD